MNWWKELNTPDNFKDDWYGELLNQSGHTLLGIVSTLIFCNVWRELSGEMPFRSMVFLATFFPYSVGIELIVQKWKPGDSWFDALMFSFGAAGVLMPFYELSVSGADTIINYSHRISLSVTAVWAAILLLRVKRRYVAT